MVSPPSVPGYHLMAPKHWLNDPNGPVSWQGRYHLFFQYNPDAPVWGRPRWAHVSSEDLVHWETHAVALEPSPEGADRDGCWSGCTRIVDGIPTIFYTGVVGHTDDDRVESVCRATPVDATLERWVKDPSPLLHGPPPSSPTGFHRDPFIFTAGDRTYLMLGTSTAATDGYVGAIHLYYQQGSRWAYQGLMFDGSADWSVDTGPLWECPQLLQLPGADVLIVSVQDPAYEQKLRHAIAFVGEFTNGTFRAGTAELLDRGDLFYAPASLTDNSRHLLWGWIQDPAPVLDDSNPHRRVGAISLPRQIEVADGRLRTTPAAELETLRTSSHTIGDVRVEGGSAHILRDLPDHAEATFRLPLGASCSVGLGPRWDSEPGHVDLTPRVSNRPAGPNDATQIRVFLDGDIIEVFSDRSVPYTSRLTRSAGARSLTITAPIDAIVIDKLAIHTLRPKLNQ